MTADKTPNQSTEHPENETDTQPESHVFELGITMRERREKRGKELAEVADLLRIRRVYLEAIEQGRLDELPDGPYAVGFVRTYAKYLRMSEDKSVKSYKQYVGATRQQAELHFPVPSQEGGLPSRVMAVLGLLMLVGVYAIWTNMQGDDVENIVSTDTETVAQAETTTETKSTDSKTAEQNSDTPPATETAPTQEQPVAQNTTETETADNNSTETTATEVTTSEETAQPQAETTPTEQTPTETPTETTVTDNTASEQTTEAKPIMASDADKRYVSDLSLNSTGHVWVVIRNGENIVIERLLASGEMLNLTQYAGYTMDLGNAGVVTLNRNNENSQVLGQLGEVKEGLLLGSALNVYFE